MLGTGFVFHPDYLKHETGAGHPERPARLIAIVRHLESVGLLRRLVEIEPRPAVKEWVAEIHTPEYIDLIDRRCREGGGYLDIDTPVSTESYRIALLAVGGVLVGVDAVVGEVVANAFCALRPPGHHAERDRGMGFCLFNNVAIAARYVQREHGLSKVFIVDWDVHHGNGTQHAFDDDPSVFYFSVHQFPHYPGTGRETEEGKGEGNGYTLNVPLSPGKGDDEYIQIFQETLRPAALAFEPDFIFISAGFDAHAEDPLSGMCLTEIGFLQMTRIVKEIAYNCCRGRLVSILEGGYDVEALSRSVESHLREMMG